MLPYQLSIKKNKIPFNSFLLSQNIRSHLLHQEFLYLKSFNWINQMAVEYFWNSYKHSIGILWKFLPLDFKTIYIYIVDSIWGLSFNSFFLSKNIQSHLLHQEFLYLNTLALGILLEIFSEFYKTFLEFFQNFYRTFLEFFNNSFH